jgi:hypothetical protein
MKTKILGIELPVMVLINIHMSFAGKYIVNEVKIG